MKEPQSEDAARCLKLRIKDKGGHGLSPEEMRFCEKLFLKYPEWYTSLDKEVFYATRPFGSTTEWRE
jgi:hypothetical protein